MSATSGNLADHIVAFARALRAAGLPVGPGTVIDALEALRHISIDNRMDVFTALQSVFVTRHEHALVFAQTFDLYFRSEDDLLYLPGGGHGAIPKTEAPAAGSRRVRDALGTQERETSLQRDQTEKLQLSVSSAEILQKKDFAQMSAEEIADALRLIQRMALPLNEIETRRFAPAAHGRRLDLRRTLRASLRNGGEIVDLKYFGRRSKPPPIVALLDISGSMSDYTRLFLHFLHAVTDARKRVSTFLFGTRLTNVTRALRARDPDEALAAVSAAVPDWAGGTRIAQSLHLFNSQWSRRVLGQGTVVLLISDGLEREADDRLAFEMDRLHRSCRRLVWLNPLLRYEGFEPRAQGIKIMLPHVDEFRPVHNLKSMGDLVSALSSSRYRHDRFKQLAA
jgi:uncharacterized protein with von Willebrand factor type A (vWA) domain